jgi:hypothetical protein
MARDRASEVGPQLLKVGDVPQNGLAEATAHSQRLSAQRCDEMQMACARTVLPPVAQGSCGFATHLGCSCHVGSGSGGE